jgi:hypothetical protein
MCGTSVPTVYDSCSGYRLIIAFPFNVRNRTFSGERKPLFSLSDHAYLSPGIHIKLLCSVLISITKNKPYLTLGKLYKQRHQRGTRMSKCPKHHRCCETYS